MALVRTRVRALDFKRNQRWKLCLTAYPRRTRTAVGSACLTIAARGSLQLDSAHRLHLLQCGHALHLIQTTRGHFDTNVLNPTQEYVVPAVEVDGKAGVEESLFVFSVAHGVIVPASGLSQG